MVRKTKKQKRKGMNLWIKLGIVLALILIVLIGLFGMSGSSDDEDGLSALKSFFSFKWLVGAPVTDYGFCEYDSDCNDYIECTIDVCTSEGCENAVTPSCCGNGVCDGIFGETPDNCPDDCSSGDDGDDDSDDGGNDDSDDEVDNTIPICNNDGKCDFGETVDNCPMDNCLINNKLLPCDDNNACTEDIFLEDKCFSVKLLNCRDLLDNKCDIKYTVQDGERNNVVCLDSDEDSFERNAEIEIVEGGCSDSIALISLDSNSIIPMDNLLNSIDEIYLEDVSSEGCLSCKLKGYKEFSGSVYATGIAGEGYKIENIGNKWRAVRIDGKTIPTLKSSRMTISVAKSSCLHNLLFSDFGRQKNMIQMIRC